MRVSNGSDECGMFGGRGEQAEPVIVDKDINGQDGGNFYSMRRRRQS